MSATRSTLRMVQPVSIVDAVTDHLRNELFVGKIKPGKTLPENEIATTYGVARPTARAVIERLVMEGLLVREPHTAARVPDLRPEDVTDIYAARALVEGAAARQLAARRIRPAAAFEANAALRALGPVYTLDVVQRDSQFHAALVDALGSERASAMYRTVSGEVRLCMARVQTRELMKASTIVIEHARILRAIETGDVVAAEDAALVHVSRARDKLLSALGRTEEGQL